MMLVSWWNIGSVTGLVVWVQGAEISKNFRLWIGVRWISFVSRKQANCTNNNQLKSEKTKPKTQSSPTTW